MIGREELVERLATVSHLTWMRQKERDQGVPRDQLSDAVTGHDRERAEDAVRELERLGILNSSRRYPERSSPAARSTSPAARLEPLGEHHLDSLGSLLADPDTHRFTRVPVPPPPDFARVWLERYEEGRRDGTREAFAIVEEPGGALLGVVMAPRIDREARTAELGYAIAPEARGRGAGTEGLRLLTGWAFAEGMLRLELLISADNEPSKRVAARCGYRLEGVMRSAYFKAGLREDTELWSRLPTDP